jgi:hypothetical protein
MTTPDGARPATAIFLDDEESAPVFVDDSGRRRRRFRMVGVAGVGLCACFIALAIVGMVGHGPFEGIRLPGLSATTRSAHHPTRTAGQAANTTVGGGKAAPRAGVDAAGGLRGSTTPTAASQTPVATPTSRPGAASGSSAPGLPATYPTTAVVTPVTPTTVANRGRSTVAPGPSKSQGNGLLNGHGPTPSPTSVPHGNAKSA